MLTVDVDQLVVTKGQVSLGLIVRYGEGGPVRFVRAALPLGLLTPHTLGLLLAEWDSVNDRVREPDDIPLF